MATGYNYATFGPITINSDLGYTKMATMLKLALTQKVSLAKDVLIQDLVQESVLLNLEREEYFGQNEVGTRMLSVLTESESIQAAYDVLLEEYEVEPERLQQDLLNFVEKLVDYELVEVTGS